MDKIIEKYARRFTNFKKKRWYLEWVIELNNFLKEIQGARKRGVR